MYQNGKGVPQDIKLAVKWYRKAAECSYSPAENILAVCFAKDLGVDKNLQEATNWYKKAIEQGNEQAMLSFASSLASHESGPNLFRGLFLVSGRLRKDSGETHAARHLGF